MKLAKYNAELFSKDPDTQVGCIIVPIDCSRILSTGINGFPRKIKDDMETGRWQRPDKYTWVTHAEVNAICNAARTGTCLDGACAIVTMFPCVNCAKTMIQAGISIIYVPNKPDINDHKWGKEFEIAWSMFEEVNITIKFLNEFI